MHYSLQAQAIVILQQKRFNHRSFCCFLFYTKVCSGQKLSTAPMAQGMNNIVYVTLRKCETMLLFKKK